MKNYVIKVTGPEVWYLLLKGIDSWSVSFDVASDFKACCFTPPGIDDKWTRKYITSKSTYYTHKDAKKYLYKFRCKLSELL